MTAKPPIDLLLTHGYFLSEDPKEQAIMKPYPPLGILYLSSHLRKRGLGVQLYDSTFGSREELYKMISNGPPSVLGIYANLMTRTSVLDILSIALAAGWTVVLGGPEPAAYPREYLEAGAHVIVQGEGEVTLEELLAALNSNGNLSKVPGLILRGADGTPEPTPPRPPIRNLDEQPWPDRGQIDIEKYIEAWREHHGMGALSIITARGCPYHCRWCSHAVYGNTHRRRSPRAVADELESLIAVYNPDMLWVADDVFTIHQGWILEYAAQIRERGLKIPFECITRADRVNARIADALADSGCFRVWIGSESGSQRILDAMDRGVSLAQVRDAVGFCRDRGIQTGMFLMWGYEGEEIPDIESTIEHVKATLPDIFLTTISYPIKGTPYFDEVASRLASSKPWADSSDRELVVGGRRSREFYAHADQLLKSEIALQKVLSGSPADNGTAQELQAQINEARRALYACVQRTP